VLPLLLAAVATFVQPDLDRLFDKLTPSTRASIENLGTGFKYLNPPESQVRLLREDLKWQNKGYSSRQIRLVSALALYKAVGNAEDELASLLELDKLTAEQGKSKEELELFIIDATTFVDGEAKALKDMRDYELIFNVT
jgi:hypothetical protein